MLFWISSTSVIVVRETVIRISIGQKNKKTFVYQIIKNLSGNERKYKKHYL